MPPISILDIIDIVLVAIILFQLYRLIRGTAALSIFLGIFLVYLFWLVVKALNMELISSILGQVIGVGMIALIIVFQQEIRRFLLIIGSRYLGKGRFSFEKIFSGGSTTSRDKQLIVEEIVRAAENLSESGTGALIVIARKSTLDLFSEGGEILNAKVSSELLQTIFTRNTPLHDGAVLIEGSRILAARCPLPATDKPNLPPRFGMRHRAAIGMTELTDALVIVVSEERSRISLADSGKIKENLKPNDLRQILSIENI
ncbi:MAG TPA: diadenylate cyclase CdaA [Bacteroidales bacterium]|nr:diadenylate cyclase CdaA [Bacteroidales bacterium]